MFYGLVDSGSTRYPLIYNSLEGIVSIIGSTTVGASASQPRKSLREESIRKKRVQSGTTEAMSLRYLPAPGQVATAVESGCRTKGVSKGSDASG